VIKSPIEKRSQVFIVAVNESHKSRIGLDILYRLMTSRDKLICLFVATSDADKQKIERLRDYYECDMIDFGPADSQFVVLHASLEREVGETMINYVNESDADFFAVAPRSKQTLSSVSDYLVSHSHKSIVLCKI
jgi:hypothetical protein